MLPLIKERCDNNHEGDRSSSSIVSFTQCSPTCERMPLPSLSLWPGGPPYKPRLVGGRIGGRPSSVAPRSRNPSTGRRRVSSISSSLFSNGPHLCAVESVNISPTEPVPSRSNRQRLGQLQSHFDAVAQ